MSTPQLDRYQEWEREVLAMQPTTAQKSVVPADSPLPVLPPEEPGEKVTTARSRKGRIWRMIAIVLVLGTAIAVYFTWSGSQQTNSASSAQAITTQSFSSSAATSKATSTPVTSDSSSIQVYIVGAVKHPGIYTLDTNARIYQALKDAGGPLANANLVAVNLAAPLKDGEEIYIPRVGEQMPTNLATSTDTTGIALTPTSTGGSVNINTASAEELRQQLHVAATTAQKIIDYRLQHGAYTSVDQLANAVSKSIYERIKGMVTI